MRMKNHMHAHVDINRHTMFNHAADTVRDQLKAMCDQICQELWDQVLQNIFKNLSRDYLSVLGTDSTKAVSAITRAERMLRGELSLMLAQDADVVFKDCLPGADTPAPDQQPGKVVCLPDEQHVDEEAANMRSSMTQDRDESVDLGFARDDDPLEDGASDGP